MMTLTEIENDQQRPWPDLSFRAGKYGGGGGSVSFRQDGFIFYFMVTFFLV